MKLLSEDLETAIDSAHGIDEEVEKGPRDSTFHSKQDIQGMEVKFFYTIDGEKQKNYLFTINGGDPTYARGNFIFQAEKEAEKAVANILKGRDQRNGQYKHQGGWDRVCKCGHTLGVHTAASVDGKRDCEACEGEGKHPSRHKFVAVKAPKG